ncbi:MAG: ribosomal protein L7/L12 [Verrucomicrobia bacterium]|nr:ribosomal protein L7/L12 [Verrucomicrobiota bacterium]
MNSTIPEAILEAIKADLRAGQKISAIKRLREAVAGMGLADAKTAVEQLHAELHAKDPVAYPAPKPAKGCLGLLLLLIGVGVAVAALLLWRK